MNRMFTIAFLAACSSANPDPIVDTTDGSVDVPESTPADRASAYLTGTFSSQKQANNNSDYYAISLRACAVDFPAMADRVLYIEQAAMDNVTQPYRQRLYVVEDLGDSQVSSTIYAFTDAKAANLVSACDAPEDITIKMKHLVEREGCTVWLTELENGDFEGATEGAECSSSLGSAVYATSEVKLEADLLLSLDQGWDAEGNQVWGAVDGPYRFLRQ